METSKMNILIKMTKSIFIICFLLLCASSLRNYSQEKTKSPENELAAVSPEQIIEKSRNAISKAVDVSKIDKFYVEMSSIKAAGNADKNSQSSQETKLSVDFPNEVLLDVYIDFSTNQFSRVEKLRKGIYSENSQVIVDNKPLYAALNLPETPRNIKEGNFKVKLFTMLFPMILTSPDYESLEFKFIGVAKSEEDDLDIIEVQMENETMIRLFFEKKSSLLKLMTEKWVDSRTKREFERKYYFSDYREREGILLANKVFIEIPNVVSEERTPTKLKIN